MVCSFLLGKVTGTKADRPEFQALLSMLETGDTLVVTKLDRFARSAAYAIQIVRQLFEVLRDLHTISGLTGRHLVGNF